ncbi:uncharacterized protein K452DRAFT_277856 [Aplosporella prunicola CBS 121167]|uniref:Uncharacterized protein n=1 Tax=Aplosporella prunicola CBS 121167 TaxID=1176127 RepID=A0A6A6B1K9_9PEZI|nr:uncharacterized protein K452DRAFT_277856 [Aplosporella prunicola CBS 121167]KAF2138102.1 hypothetical protein K452DRAFT_277856 [Aplosporella prunicola CBS 121167]
MSFSYDRYDRRQPSSRRRTTLGYWVPLALTVTVATAGIAAWVWSERRDTDDDDGNDSDLVYGEDKRDLPPEVPPPTYRGVEDDESVGIVREEEGGFMARMSGAIRRTPSPQQVFDSASRRVAAGVAAAGAAFGGALSAIREEDRDDFGDHSRWSEEAARRQVEAQSAESSAAVGAHTDAFNASLKGPSQALKAGVKRKTVVVVVSADFMGFNDDEHGLDNTDHPSLLSQLPPTNFATTKLFILIYAPSIKPLSSSSDQVGSIGSSFSAISTPSQTTGEELLNIDPQPFSDNATPKAAATPTVLTPAMTATDADNAVYDAMKAQALERVEKPNMVMPFGTPSGHIHMLRHIAPDIVYITEDLAGDNGVHVEQIKSWVGQVMVVVGAGGSGLGGLVDTEDESEGNSPERKKKEKWWETGTMVGLGKGVEVVDGAKMVDDFERRVGGKE